jgi:hypothetical protein
MKLLIFSHLIIFVFLVGQTAFASEITQQTTDCEINSMKGSLILKENFDKNLLRHRDQVFALTIKNW